MTVSIAASGAAAEAIDQVVPQLVADEVASAITASDPTLWGPVAEDGASRRLGWVEAVSASRPLVDAVSSLRTALRSRGVDRVVLLGSGGSPLASDVIARTAGAPLMVLDPTGPVDARAAFGPDLDRTAVVLSSPSGTELESDELRRVAEAAFRDAGIDPAERIVVVTDPGSSLDTRATESGYRVFHSEPTVDDRYTALSAASLVPAGLAGADIAELLDEADAISALLATDTDENPALVLGAVLGGTTPLRSTVAIVPDGTHIVGFADWSARLVAESTGHDSGGLVALAVGPDAPELDTRPSGVQVVRLVGSRRDERHIADDELEITGSLGAQFLTWHYAVAVAARLLGVDPFSGPDGRVTAGDDLVDAAPADAGPAAPAFTEAGIAVSATAGLATGTSLREAVTGLLAELDGTGHLTVQIVGAPVGDGAAALRSGLAAHTGRPVVLDHVAHRADLVGRSSGDRPGADVVLQIVAEDPAADLPIPGRAVAAGRRTTARAAGDAGLLAAQDRPVLTLTSADVDAAIQAVASATT